MRFGTFFFRPRTSKKKGFNCWSTPVCDCLEKESKTVILSDNSNEPELRARSDKATTRCRKQKLLRLRQRCTGSAVVHGQPFHGVTCVLLAGACVRGGCNWLQPDRPGRETLLPKSALCMPTVRVHGFELRLGKSARSACRRSARRGQILFRRGYSCRWGIMAD